MRVHPRRQRLRLCKTNWVGMASARPSPLIVHLDLDDPMLDDGTTATARVQEPSAPEIRFPHNHNQRIVSHL